MYWVENPDPRRDNIGGTPCSSMTSIFMHTVAHSTRHSFWPKTNNQPLKINFKVNFLRQKFFRIILKKIFIEEYYFRGTFFVIDILWKIQFLNCLIFLNDVQFLTTFTQLTARLKTLFKGLVVGFEPKGMPDRMCNSVR